jgi:hypothetical protein
LIRKDSAIVVVVWLEGGDVGTLVGFGVNKHAVAPFFVIKPLSGHFSQKTEPLIGEKCPAAQRVEISEPADAQKLPGGHGIQLADPMLPWYVPAGHTAQLSIPNEAWK